MRLRENGNMKELGLRRGFWRAVAVLTPALLGMTLVPAARAQAGAARSGAMAPGPTRVHRSGPSWLRPSAAELSRAVAAGYAVTAARETMVAEDAGPYRRLVWSRARSRRPAAPGSSRPDRAESIVVTPPLRCAWEHGVLYAARGLARPDLDQTRADCERLVVLYISTAPAAAPAALAAPVPGPAADAGQPEAGGPEEAAPSFPVLHFFVRLRHHGMALAPTEVVPDSAPLALRDRAGRYYAYATLFFFRPPRAWSDQVTIEFGARELNGGARKSVVLDFAPFAADLAKAKGSRIE